MANCKQWRDCGVKGGGCCALNLFGGKPSEGVCNICKQREPIDNTINPQEVYTKIATVAKKGCPKCKRNRS